jgi:hypothetical protein
MSVVVGIKSVFDAKGIKDAEKAFGGVSNSVGKLAGTLGVALSGAALISFGKNSLKAAEDAQVANNRLDAIAESMGIFGSETDAVTGRLKSFAEQQMMIVGADDELIKSTQAKLLTFQNLAVTADQAGGAFDRATIAAFDLGAAGFGSAESAATQLGKALQDPVGQLGALRKAGVTFTDSEKEKIKVLVESGEVLKAQDMLLSAIEKQVGGTAAATVTSTQKMALIFGELAETTGAALLPAAEAVATTLQTQLVPIIEQLGAYLESPEGSAAIQNFANAIAGAVTNLIDAAKWIGENFDAVSRLATGIGIAVGVYKTLETTLAVAKVAQLLFNSAALANPYVFGAILIAGGISLVAGVVTGLANQFGNATTETDNAANAAARLNNADLSRLDGRLGNLQIQANNVANALNAASGIPAPVTTDVPRPNNPRPGQKFTFYRLNGPNNQAIWYEQTWTGTEWTKAKKVTYTPTGGGAKDEKDTTAERFAKVQDVIKKAQKAILQAEKDYARTRFQLIRDSGERVTAIEKEFEDKRKDFVKESVSRLTDAFRSATQLSLGDLFNKKTETQLLTDVRRISENLTLTVTKEVEKSTFSSVQSIVDGLRERLTGSRKLLENASKLSAAGFSETFIQQVIETGAETGNELASAILAASPETQAQMRQLFNELESVSATGMDAVAQQILDKSAQFKTGLLAIQLELDNALIAEQARLSTALAEAGIAFAAAMADIKATFMEDLGSFDGWFAGLKGTIDALLLKMNELKGKGLTDVQKAITMPNTGTILANAQVTSDVTFSSLAPLKAVQGIVIDSLEDVAGTVAYLQARIDAGNRYITNIGKNTQLGMDARGRVTGFEQELATLRANTALGTVAGTTININVKTDTTQSQAMVGKTIGNIVTKYVTTGGQVLVSGQ